MKSGEPCLAMAQHTDKKPRLTSHLKQDAPWVEKFRPKSLDEVAAHKEIIDTSKIWPFMSL